MDAINSASLLIRMGVGIIMILFGVSQLRTPEKWLGYMPGIIRFLMPVSNSSFMRMHGAINFILGLLLSFGAWQPATIWIAIFWWISILPFAFYYEYSVGLRDVSIILALIALLVLHNG